MSPQIFDHRTVHTQSYVRPAHAGSSFPIKLVVLPVGNILEIKNPVVVVILSREDNLVEICGMDIGNRVLVGVPASKAQIETTHEGRIINYAQLLMVCPVEDHIVIHAVNTFEGVAG